MKQISKLFIIFIVCLSLCACGNTSQNTIDKNTTTETENKRYSLENEDEKAELISAMDLNIELIKLCNLDMYRRRGTYYSYSYYYWGISDTIEFLQSQEPSNIFVSELFTRYKELQLENKTDLEKDFFEILPMLMSEGINYNKSSKGFAINPEEFGKAWIIGYSDKQLNNELPYNARTIFLEIPESTFCEVTGKTATSENGIIYICYTAYECENGTLQLDIYFYDYTNFVELTGIDIATDSGVCSNNYEVQYNENLSDEEKRWEDIKHDFNGTAYNSITNAETREILSEYYNFNELLKLFVDTKVLTFDKDAYFEARRTEAEPPAIGMTKAEVLNGAWGTPDKKNIDEYEWGTKEQWVYDNHGYVYFEDGIVTAIQHREEE